MHLDFKNESAYTLHQSAHIDRLDKKGGIPMQKSVNRTVYKITGICFLIFIVFVGNVFVYVINHKNQTLPYAMSIQEPFGKPNAAPVTSGSPKTTCISIPKGTELWETPNAGSLGKVKHEVVARVISSQPAAYQIDPRDVGLSVFSRVWVMKDGNVYVVSCK
jgi:hypothetical protein